MLGDKQLREKRKEVEQIEAEWEYAQKDVPRSKLSFSYAEANNLAREHAAHLVHRKWPKIQIQCPGHLTG